MKYPKSIQDLITEFSKLPTVGPKTAERFVLFLLKQNQSDLESFSSAVSKLKQNIKICKDCLSVSDVSPCSICTDQKRSDKYLCIVATTRDMLTIEATNEFDGKYFVLGGVLNPVEGKGPDTLNIKKLQEKINNSKVEEIILALNADIEGETTSMYIKKLFDKTNIKISKLARGLPMGSDLEYADPQTLSNALKYRNTI